MIATLQKIFLCILCIFGLITGVNTAQSQTPDWYWAQSSSEINNRLDRGTDAATDAQGNVYVTGYFVGDSITFDSITLKNTTFGNDVSDMFIVKYSPAGTVLWARSQGSTIYDEGDAVTVDNMGNVYLAGTFGYSMTIGDTTLDSKGTSDIAIIKYDPDGNVLWAKSIGGAHNERSHDIDTDKDGNLYFTGNFASPSITIGTETFTKPNDGNDDMMLVKFDSDGNILWADVAGGNTSDGENSLDVEQNGTIYLTGGFSSPSITIGGITLTRSGLTDVFIAKYTKDGTVLWAKAAPGDGYDKGTGILSDELGNIYVTGFFKGTTIRFESITLSNAKANTSDIFVVKYSSDGKVLWVRSAGGDGPDNSVGIARGVGNTITISGDFASPALSFGDITLTRSLGAPNYYNADIFNVGYDPDGNIQWAVSAGGPGDEIALGMTTDKNGNSITTGYFNSPQFTLGKDSLQGSFAKDMFVVKLGDRTTDIATVDDIFESITLVAYDKMLHISGLKDDDWGIVIYTVTGEIVYQGQCNNTWATINLSHKAYGVYCYQLIRDSAVLKTGTVLF